MSLVNGSLSGPREVAGGYWSPREGDKLMLKTQKKKNTKMRNRYGH